VDATASGAQVVPQGGSPVSEHWRADDRGSRGQRSRVVLASVLMSSSRRKGRPNRAWTIRQSADDGNRRNSSLGSTKETVKAIRAGRAGLFR
jgi:hypothetical protein